MATNDQLSDAGAAEVEAAVCDGRSAVILEERSGLSAHEISPDLAFVLGRAAEEEETFDLAAALFERSRAGDDALRLRSDAHLAHLDYYAGRYLRGLDRLAGQYSNRSALAWAEAHLYRSVNLVTLGRSREALNEAIHARNLAQRVRDARLRADLRFRVCRQVVHVLVARGEYLAAAAEAEAARAIAERSRSSAALALSSYLRGYVAASRGDESAVADIAAADRLWGGRAHAFGRWLRYVWACVLRDRGEASSARQMKEASGIVLQWEEPLFELAFGQKPRLLELDGCPPDERPFRCATNGLLLWLDGRADLALAPLSEATDEFRRTELHHYGRGANLVLAAALSATDPDRARAILSNEASAVARSQLRRWPWWHPRVAATLAGMSVRLGAAPEVWRAVSRRDHRSSSLADVLRRAGLTPCEIEVVSGWLAYPTGDRATRAARLDISEASLRNHLNGARRKLGCGSRRGLVALRERIDAIASLP